MNAVSAFTEGVQWAHRLIEKVVADVTLEQVPWHPPGLANPLGAVCAHVVLAEDAVVNGMLKRGAPLFAGEWARELRLDLPALRQYAQAVYAATDAYLASLTDDDLDTRDLSNVGFGHKPVS